MGPTAQRFTAPAFVAPWFTAQRFTVLLAAAAWLALLSPAPLYAQKNGWQPDKDAQPAGPRADSAPLTRAIDQHLEQRTRHSLELANHKPNQFHRLAWLQRYQQGRRPGILRQ